MEPQISVILPFFNAEAFIKDSIESVFSSTFDNFELILINDGSTDSSLSIAKMIAAKDSRIRLFSREHEGIAAALNHGISYSESEIIARMDADDICQPARFQLQYEMLKTNRNIALTSCIVEPFSNGSISEGMKRHIDWVNSSVMQKEIFRDLFIESPLIHSSVMFRKSVIDQVGAYREYNGPEDYDLWLRMAEAGMIFFKVKKHLLRYRIHECNLSMTDSTHYSKKAFFQRKLPFLLYFLKKQNIASERPIHICGFAQSGKRLFSFLHENGIHVETFIDISPKKVGSLFCGAPVLSPDAINQYDCKAFYLCVIKSWGAAEELRTFFSQQKKFEMDDYLIL